MNGCDLSSSSGFGALAPASSVQRVDAQGPHEEGQREARRRSRQKGSDGSETPAEESVQPDVRSPEPGLPEHNLDRLA
jgi:hypothetical protein